MDKFRGLEDVREKYMWTKMIPSHLTKPREVLNEPFIKISKSFTTVLSFIDPFKDLAFLIQPQLPKHCASEVLAITMCVW